MLSLEKKFQSGLTLVEVLIASSIILIFFMALVGVYNTYLRMSKANINTVKAVFLDEEAIEAVKFLRDSSWTDYISPLSFGTNYYLIFNGGMWKTTTTNTYIDGMFERKINISNVNRDPVSMDIVTSGGVDDPNTKFVTATVSWQNRGATSTKAISTYVTNLFAN